MLCSKKCKSFNKEDKDIILNISQIKNDLSELEKVLIKYKANYSLLESSKDKDTKNWMDAMQLKKNNSKIILEFNKINNLINENPFELVHVKEIYDCKSFAWNLMNATENLFKKIFYDMLNSSMMKSIYDQSDDEDNEYFPELKNINGLNRSYSGTFNNSSK